MGQDIYLARRAQRDISKVLRVLEVLDRDSAGLGIDGAVDLVARVYKPDRAGWGWVR